MKVTLIGIDLAKSIFQVCAVNQAGKPVFNRQVRRNRLLGLLVQYPDATIAMEACSGSNYWGRELKKRGFQVLLIPPQHVKPFVKSNKNDRNDALAICEAADRPNLRCIEPRSLEQTDIMLIHRMLQRRIRARSTLIHQLRGLLNEYGVVVARGKERLRAELPLILENTENELTDIARHHLHQQWLEWSDLDQGIADLEQAIRLQARDNEQVMRLTQIKGVGNKIASAMTAYIGNGQGYQNGRHLAANLGLVPNQHSSGGKPRLGRISRRGNTYLRQLLVQGAWSVVRYADRGQDRLSRWTRQIIERRGKHKAVIAVANKLARIIWAMSYHGSEYQAA